MTVIVVSGAGLDFPHGYPGLRVPFPFSLFYLVDTDLATTIINFNLCPRVSGPGCLGGRLVDCHRLPENVERCCRDYKMTGTVRVRTLF
jgi:hypothetical protein